MNNDSKSLMRSLMLLALASAVSSPAAAVGVLPTKPAVLAPRIYPDPRIVDLGVAASTDVRPFTITMAVRNRAALDALAASVGDPSSPNFRKFITPQQFAASYGQTPAAIAQVLAFLKDRGFSVVTVHTNNLLITAQGSNAQIAATFGSAVHSYSLLGQGFQAAPAAPVVPAALASIVTSVSGLSNKPHIRPHSVRVSSSGMLAGEVVKKTGFNSIAGNPAGNYTVLDLAAKYNINPLYARGLTGAGKTIGIATMAGYNQSDAYTYWGQIDLTVSPNRIVDVPVDGGPLPADGPGSDGSGETTLDVEQAGGVAPGAAMRVYLAPNTDVGFVDVFAQAVGENLVDVLSISWGSPEVGFDIPLDSFHVLFEQAAVQGIPVIAAAGDAGAFDANRGFTYPQCSTLLSVDYPAADPLVLAAGGTTLPNTFQHTYGPVTETVERAWGWDYVKPYVISNYGTSKYYAEDYTVGGGGGVSVAFGLPDFQKGLAGLQSSASAQSLLCSSAFLGLGGTAYQDMIDLPAGVAGRNLPDVSLNADPFSGYVIFQGGWIANEGGTSFVAPQLNGILTLIASGLPGRIGPINPQLYASFKAKGYGPGSPFKAITAGNNGYYQSTPGYNPATGLGSLDVSVLATVLGLK